MEAPQTQSGRLQGTANVSYRKASIDVTSLKESAGAPRNLLLVHSFYQCHSEVRWTTKGPPNSLSPSSKCLSFSICAPNSPHSKWACLLPMPWGRQSGLREPLGLPARVSTHSAQGDTLRDSRYWGEGGRALCAPRALTHPAIGFLREPQPSPHPRSLVLLLNSQSKRHLWHPLAHQLGPFRQASTALVPAQAAQ